MNGSMKTVPSPNADSASRAADSTASASSDSSRTTRMPLPPPPAAAFTSTGIVRPGRHRARCGVVDRRGRHTRFDRRLLRRHLVAEQGDLIGGRPDPDQPGVDHGPCERRVLGEEAVAGVDRVASGVERGLEHSVPTEVRLGRARPTERHGEVDRVDVQRVAVGLGVHADRLDAHLAGRRRDPHGDLAAVGDEQAADHQWRQIPYSRVPSTTLLWAAEIAIARTVRVSRGWMIPSSQTRPVA